MRIEIQDGTKKVVISIQGSRGSSENLVNLQMLSDMGGISVNLTRSEARVLAKALEEESK